MDGVILILYDPKEGRFIWQNSDCSNLARKKLGEDLSGANGLPLRSRILAMAQAGVPQAEVMELNLDAQILRATIVCSGADNPVSVTLSQSANRSPADDILTGLLSWDEFNLRAERLLNSLALGAQQGYSLVCLDISRFKVLNDLFGRQEGDRLLRFVADSLKDGLYGCSFGCRMMADSFALLLDNTVDPRRLLDELQQKLSGYGLPFEVAFHAGIYELTGEKLSISEMHDCASLAKRTIKGKYNQRYVYYREEMHRALLSEQEISGMMATALAEGQFRVCYQPQYNHSTGMLIGAEALVRWHHPEKGLISPASFIPIFEKNGFITNLDLDVFRQVCAFLRKCMDNHWSMVPISTNLSRHDIFLQDLPQRLELIRQEYDVPSKFLRLELTESAMVDGADYINSILGKLHDYGYVIEMDDFGSGYSSLNVLKDMDLDVIKLDMKFLSQDADSGRGGTILSSVVRMARWLNMPVIAEGVETVEQADFLRSIGCDYVQGYLYSRPLPEEQYIHLLSSKRIGAAIPQLQLIDTLNANNFWDPKSQETLIFSNYVGAAAIFTYNGNQVELLRVNQKYLQEFGMNLSEKEMIRDDPLEEMDPANRKKFINMLERAIATMEEQECETWRNISSSCCGDERFCIRSTVRVIGVSGDLYLFHGMVRNITNERLYLDSLRDNERRTKMVSEQLKVYYWEYIIATKEMRPCFRCMRDLGLPPVLTNYPESAIEAFIFPPEVADMYREFMHQIDEGAPEMEAVIPLTLDRVPFKVRYTTEFDDNGHPVRAYGSAELIGD